MAGFPEIFLTDWSDWYLLPSTASSVSFEDEEKYFIAPPYAPIPDELLPASSLFVFSGIFHCSFINPFYDPTLLNKTVLFNQATSTVVSGGFVGALGGLNLALSALNIPSGPFVQYKLGPRNNLGSIFINYGPMSTGFCLGESLKEQSYFQISQAHTGIEDVYQNSSFKRVLLHFGDVTGYERINEQRAKITIDSSSVKDEDVDIPNVSIRVIFASGENRVGKSVILDVLEYDDFFNFIVPTSEDAEQEPRAGDFFEISTPICLEDPYLLSGIWLGQESERGAFREYNLDLPQSGFDYPVTTENRFYDKGEFTGVYILSDGNKEYSYVSNASFSDQEIDDETTLEWYWIPLRGASSNDEVLQYYPNENIRFKTNRYFTVGKEPEEENPEQTLEEEFEANNPLREIRKIGNRDMVSRYFNLSPSPSIIRVEISTMGNGMRSNFHAPILRRAYLRQNGKFFKILGQPDGGTIDVSILSIDQSSVINVEEEFEIFNNFGWMINEHESFSQPFIQDGLNNAFSTYLNESSKISLTNKYNPPYMQINGELKNSYEFRFFNEFPMNENLLKGYSKYSNWALVNEDRTQAINVLDVSYNGSYDPFSNNLSEDNIFFEVEGDLNNLKYTTELSDGTIEERQSSPTLLFQNDYKFLLNNPLNGSRLNILDLSNNDFFPTTEQLCVGGGVYSPRFEVNIPSQTSLGICDNRWFGYDFLSPRDPMKINTGAFWVSTLAGSKSISAVRDGNQEIILYKDGFSKRYSLRKGRENFVVEGQKIEIYAGNPQGYGQNTTLNTNFDRVVGLFLGNSNEKYLLLKYGNGLTYGVMVSDDGSADNQFFRMNDSLSNKNYLNNGSPVSPVIMEGGSTPFYNPLGISSNVGSITIDGNVNLLYAYDNQTLTTSSSASFYKGRGGDYFVIYGDVVGEVQIDGLIYNSKDQDNEWDINNAIFILGSKDQGETWGHPLFGSSTWETFPENQFPVMILDNSIFLDSVHDLDNNYIGIVSKSYDEDGNVFVGFLLLQTNTLTNETYLGTDKESTSSLGDIEKEERLKFNFRPLRLPQNPPSIQEDPNNKVYFAPDSATFRDRFVRILGEEETRAQNVTSDGLNSIFQCYRLDDSNLVIFYSDTLGVRVLYSNDQGEKWTLSGVVIHKGGRAPCFQEYLGIAFIDGDGIKVKPFPMELLWTIVRGVVEECEELIQGKFDELPVFFVDAERVIDHKMSFVEDVAMANDNSKKEQSQAKLVYYVGDALKAKISTDKGETWQTAPNF